MMNKRINAISALTYTYLRMPFSFISCSFICVYLLYLFPFSSQNFLPSLKDLKILPMLEVICTVSDYTGLTNEIWVREEVNYRDTLHLKMIYVHQKCSLFQNFCQHEHCSISAQPEIVVDYFLFFTMGEEGWE